MDSQAYYSYQAKSPGFLQPKLFLGMPSSPMNKQWYRREAGRLTDYNLLQRPAGSRMRHMAQQRSPQLLLPDGTFSLVLLI